MMELIYIKNKNPSDVKFMGMPRKAGGKYYENKAGLMLY
jgi:hypothetical protein